MPGAAGAAAAAGVPAAPGIAGADAGARDGVPDKVPIRPASTVMLVRDGARGVEVFTLRRAASLAFAAGMTAFPGGGVDAADYDATLPWFGPDVSWWAERWRIGEESARGQVVAAVRELYEETGVLLAGDMPPVGPLGSALPLGNAVPLGAAGSPSGAGGAARAAEPAVRQARARPAQRAELAAHRTSLAAVLRDRGLPLRSDLLRPWARWVTPPGPARRYDTYFFLAALPEGQRPDYATSEAVAGAWHRPGEVLRAAERGEVGLMPPTVAMMTDLADAAEVADLLAVERVVAPVTPTVLTADGEVLRVRAAGREYASRLRHR